MNVIDQIKYKFSESFRIRIGCGLSAIRNDREYRALIEFCKEQLLDKEHMRLNPDRKRVYEMTVKLDKNLEKDKAEIIKWKVPTPQRIYDDPYDFIDDHVGWYWS